MADGHELKFARLVPPPSDSSRPRLRKHPTHRLLPSIRALVAGVAREARAAGAGAPGATTRSPPCSCLYGELLTLPCGVLGSPNHAGPHTSPISLCRGLGDRNPQARRSARDFDTDIKIMTLIPRALPDYSVQGRRGLGPLRPPGPHQTFLLQHGLFSTSSRHFCQVCWDECLFSFPASGRVWGPTAHHHRLPVIVMVRRCTAAEA